MSFMAKDSVIQLKSRSYHMGSRDIFRYTDNFEDLVDLAGFEDLLVKVTNYRTGLNPAINLAITGSSNTPDLRDYAAWRLHRLGNPDVLVASGPRLILAMQFGLKMMDWIATRMSGAFTFLKECSLGFMAIV
ncbi:hypothetical protein B0H13DRAFT_2319258 [Mycena leptocephala]|nr:hypothetical protein B0H13DRAFT_2319258 [Mycena leptocephala]